MRPMKQQILLKSFVMLTLASMLVHCGVESTKSRQSHVIGQTTYPRSKALESCQDSASKEHPLVVSYLQKIVTHIIEKNPNTFQGLYSASSFCVQLKTNDAMLGDKSPNASAQINSGLLTFNVPVIMEVPNDASLAAVVAHELAHVTRDHARTEPDAVKNNSEYQKMKAAIKELEKSRDELMEKSLPDYQSVFKKINDVLEDASLKPLKDEVLANFDYFIDEIKSSEGRIASGAAEPWVKGSLIFSYNYFLSEFAELAASYSSPLLADIKTSLSSTLGPIKTIDADLKAKRESERKVFDQLAGGVDASYSWREQEADEVGYELYLRAGLSSPLYTWIHGFFLNQGPRKSKEECGALLDKGKIPDRGQATHPSSCWRIYDISVMESAQHQADYKDLLPNATAETLFPGELESVKTYLRGL